MEELVKAEHHQSVQGFMDTEDIEFGYCTEFMVRFEKDRKAFSEDKFKDDLSKYGDSLLVIADDQVVKVHIHSEQPGEVLTYGQQYGSLINIKIENMREQHSNILHGESSHLPIPERKEKQPYAIIAVSMGAGIAELFKSIGVTEVIEGGQTMNPSTEDIMKAIERTNAEKIIILPNNKNIIMAAEQAAEIAEEEVVVIPSKTVPQGLVAMLAFNESLSLDENIENMNEALLEVKTGQVTHAVRDTNIDGLKINKDDYMGIFDGDIVVVDKNVINTAKELLQKMIDDDSEIVTILYGEDVENEIVDQLVEFIEEKFSDVEVEVHEGNQPLYPFIFSVE